MYRNYTKMLVVFILLALSTTFAAPRSTRDILKEDTIWVKVFVIQGHEYLVSRFGGIYHGESCPCKNMASKCDSLRKLRRQ